MEINELDILNQLPKSFNEIYAISNNIRKQKTDNKKRVREDDSNTQSGMFE